MKKVIAFILGIALVLGLTFPAAAVSTTAKSNTKLAPLTLKYYLIGDEQKDSKTVWTAINAKLKKDINTTINPVIIPWADEAQKYPLIFASGERFDMAWAGNWQDYAGLASKGAFKEITDDMIKKYCPDALTQLPAESLKQAKVGGKRYMIPFAEKTSDNICVVARGDLRAKYNLPAITSLTNMEKYCDALVKNEKDIIPMADDGVNNAASQIALLANMSHWQYVLNNVVAYDFTKANPIAFSVFDRPEYLTFLLKMKEYKDKGYISKSALTSNSPRNAEFKAGRGGLAFGNLNDDVALYQEVNKAHPEWKLEITNADWGGKIATQPAVVHGTTIHATSKNAERVLMAVNLLSYKQDYNRLVNYGIEGKDYKVTNGAYEPLNTDYVGTNYSAWAFRGKYLLKPANVFPGYDSLVKFQVDNSATSPICAFSLETSNIKNEVAACTELQKSKANVMIYGSVPDTKKAIEDLVASAKAAGIDKIVTEANKQIKAYLADYNK